MFKLIREHPLEFWGLAVAVAGFISSLVISLIANSHSRKANRAATAANTIAEASSQTAERVLRHQVISDLFKEYRSEDMYSAIRMMWNVYRNVEGQPPYLLREVYDLTVEREMRDNEGVSATSMNRRRVSQFYEQLAILSYKDEVFRDLVYEIWGKENLEIIPRVLIPIECLSIMKMKEMPEPKNYNSTLFRMYDLWDNAPNDSEKKRGLGIVL